MIDDHDRCEWVNVSSGLSCPGQNLESLKQLCVCVCVLWGLNAPTNPENF